MRVAWGPGLVCSNNNYICWRRTWPEAEKIKDFVEGKKDDWWVLGFKGGEDSDSGSSPQMGASCEQQQ